MSDDDSVDSENAVLKDLPKSFVLPQEILEAWDQIDTREPLVWDKQAVDSLRVALDMTSASMLAIAELAGALWQNDKEDALLSLGKIASHAITTQNMSRAIIGSLVIHRERLRREAEKPVEVQTFNAD